MRTLTTLSLLLMLSGFASAATLHVAVNGQDTADGRPGSPLASMSRACELAYPGDTIIVQGGIYPLVASERIQVRGTAVSPITIRAADGEYPVFDANALPLCEQNKPGPRFGGAIQVENSAHVRLIGLSVSSSRYAGFVIRGSETSHIALLGCRTDGSWGPGIILYQATDCRIADCDVVGANDRTLANDEWRKTAAPHESISIMGAKRFEVVGNRVRQGRKEGIDCKETSEDGLIADNEVYECLMGIYVDAWFGELRNIRVRANRVHDCDWGIVIGAEGQGAVARDIDISNNVVYRNRGSGLLFGTYGADGLRSDVRVRNNTFVANGKGGLDHWAGGTGGIDFRSTNLVNLDVSRNIVYANGAFELATRFPPEERDSWLANNRIAFQGNLFGTAHAPMRRGTYLSAMFHYIPDHSFQADPRFLRSPTADFRLQANSPAAGRLPNGDWLGALPPVDWSLPVADANSSVVRLSTREFVVRTGLALAACIACGWALCRWRTKKRRAAIK